VFKLVSKRHLVGTTNGILLRLCSPTKVLVAFNITTPPPYLVDRQGFSPCLIEQVSHQRWSLLPGRLILLSPVFSTLRMLPLTSTRIFTALEMYSNFDSHGARLDQANKDWHLTSPTPYDPPLTYGGWTQSRALGARIATLLQTRESSDLTPPASSHGSPGEFSSIGVKMHEEETEANISSIRH
jgi:hypothetical protein